MDGDGIGELLDQRPKLINFGRQRISERVGVVGACPDLLDGSEPPSDFGDLPRQIGAAAGQFEELAAEPGARPHLGRHEVVDAKRGEHHERDRHRFRGVEGKREIEQGASGAGDQHHADSDEDGTEAHALSTPGNQCRPAAAGGGN